MSSNAPEGNKASEPEVASDVENAPPQDTNTTPVEDTEIVPEQPAPSSDDLSLDEETVEVRAFIESVRQSRLLSLKDIRRILRSSRVKHGSVPNDPQLLARDFVSSGAVTAWQADYLLKGRTRGFFIGKYKLLNFLGKGGMGTVYLAEHKVIQRPVAIKVLSKHTGKVGLQLLETEARTAAQLDHPNIVRAHDFDCFGKYHYIVMDYVDGVDLHRKVVAQGAQPIAAALDYILQAARGLVYAHENGVIHRDIKPANLILDRDGVIKLSDMGLVLSLSEKERLGSSVGTADYAAPEQITQGHAVDARADIYGLGCTFFFLLAGQPPFGVGSAAERMARNQTDDTPDVRQHRSDCPRELAGVCWKMMQKKPSDRFRTMRELVEVLEKLHETLPELALDSGHLANLQNTSVPEVDPESSSLLGSSASNSDLLATGSSGLLLDSSSGIHKQEDLRQVELSNAVDEITRRGASDSADRTLRGASSDTTAKPAKKGPSWDSSRLMFFSGLAMMSLAILLMVYWFFFLDHAPSKIKVYEDEAKDVIIIRD